MYSFKESSTCEYDVIVLSPLLCKHPDYRPEEANENVIKCESMDEETPYKPKELIKLEAESLKLRSEKMFEGNFMQGETPGSVKIEIRPVDPDGDFDDDDLNQEVDRHRDANWPDQASHRQPIKPLMDPEIVKEFLMGEYCLYGGTGWWRYEFCYGIYYNIFILHIILIKTVI